MAASYHARFLRSLVENDIFKSRRGEREQRGDNMPIDPRLQGKSPQRTQLHGRDDGLKMDCCVLGAALPAAVGAQGYAGQQPQQQVQTQQQQQHVQAPSQAQTQAFHFPASPHLPAHPQAGGGGREHEYGAADLPTRSLGNAPLPPGQSYPGGYIPPAPHSSELDQRYWKNMFIELGFGESDAPLALQSVVLAPQYMDQQQQQRHAMQAHGMGQMQQYQAMHGPAYGH